MQAKKVSNTEAASSSEKALVPREDIRNEENVVDIALVLHKSSLRAPTTLDPAKNTAVKLGTEYAGKENMLGPLNFNPKRAARAAELKGGLFLRSKEDKPPDKHGRVGVMKQALKNKPRSKLKPPTYMHFQTRRLNVEE